MIAKYRWRPFIAAIGSAVLASGSSLAQQRETAAPSSAESLPPKAEVTANPPTPQFLQGEVTSDSDAKGAACHWLGLGSTASVECVHRITVLDDPTLITDEPISASNPHWLVVTKPVSIDLEADGRKGKTSLLVFSVLLRGRDGAPIRIQTPDLRLNDGRTAMSLAAGTYRRKLEESGCRQEFGRALKEPKSTLPEALSAILKAFGGGPDNAQQIIAYPRDGWGEVKCNRGPCAAWVVNLRSVSGGTPESSQVGGIEGRLPIVPPFTELTHVVEDGALRWLQASNTPAAELRSGLIPPAPCPENNPIPPK